MKKQVTSPMTPGQMKRIIAILAESVPQTEITKIMGNALTEGVLKEKMMKLWIDLGIEFRPYGFGEIMPSRDIAAVQRFVDSVVEFKEEDFSLPLDPNQKKLLALPFNFQCRSVDIEAVVRENGYELGYPEDLLGLILRHQRGLCIGRLSYVIVPGRRIGKYDYMVLRTTASAKMHLCREHVPLREVFGGEYSVLVSERP